MNYFNLLVPFALILTGIYLKINKNREVNAPKYLWLVLIILGVINLIFKLIK